RLHHSKNSREFWTAIWKSTLEFCGIKPVKVFTIGPIRNSTLDARNKWLKEVAGIGTKEANSHSSF
ncbi:MAG TPA: hypothetical protein PLG30_14930, partial [Bacteroidia bacterium]|nr:hypothetical protein [Bacteroidia bacterium]